MIDQYRQGKFHFIFVPAKEISALRKDTKISKQMSMHPDASVYGLEMNPNLMKPLNDVRVRRALAMSLDRKFMTSFILNTGVEPAKQILPPHMINKNYDEVGLKLNIKAANRLLDEAGYQDRSTFPKLHLVVSHSSIVGRPLAENTVVQWNKNLGIKAAVKTMDGTMVLQKVNQKQIPLRLASKQAQINHPNALLGDHYATQGLNSINLNDKEFDRICTQLCLQTDSDKRVELCKQAEKILLQKAVFIPLVHPKDTYLIKDQVEGLKFNLFGFLPLNTVSLKS